MVRAQGHPKVIEHMAVYFLELHYFIQKAWKPISAICWHFRHLPIGNDSAKSQKVWKNADWLHL